METTMKDKKEERKMKRKEKIGKIQNENLTQLTKKVKDGEEEKK